MIPGGHPVRERPTQDYNQTDQSTRQMQRMCTGQNIEERTVYCRRKVHTRVDELTPDQELTDEKSEAEDPAHRKPLPDRVKLILADGRSRKLNGDAAGKQD